MDISVDAGWITTVAFWGFLVTVCIIVYLPLLFEAGSRIRPKGL
jgi:hypothetical protein